MTAKKFGFLSKGFILILFLAVVMEGLSLGFPLFNHRRTESVVGRVFEEKGTPLSGVIVDFVENQNKIASAKSDKTDRILADLPASASQILLRIKIGKEARRVVSGRVRIKKNDSSYFP